MKLILSILTVFLCFNAQAEELEAPDSFSILKIVPTLHEDGEKTVAIRWENRGDVSFYEITVYSDDSSRVVCQVEPVSGVHRQSLLNHCSLEPNKSYNVQMTAYNEKGLTEASYLKFIGE